MNVIGHKWIYLSVSGLLVAASVVVIFAIGFRPGIDFVGGTLWEMKFNEKSIAREALETFFVDNLKIADVIVTPITEGSLIVRSPEIKEVDHVLYVPRIEKEFGKFEELRFESIGAAVGHELRGKAITAFFLVLLGISFYIAFAFRKVSRPVSSWKYGVITLLTLFHDALIPAGLFAILGYTMNVEVDTNFIVAILVVMGFSVHDTIVVFDRIRENLRLFGTKMPFEELVNASVNQTMARSLNTSLTVILVLATLFALGSPTLRYFILTIGVGTIVGTYSSIFVASPFLTLWRKRE